MYVLKNKLYLLAVALIDFCGYIIISALRIFRAPRFPDKVNNILVIRLDHIGDVVSAISTAENLKSQYPGARIDFLSPSWAGQLLKGNPYIDKIIFYDAPWFNRSSKNLLRPVSFFRLAGELRKGGYDLGFDLRGDIRHILLMALGRVRFKVSYGITGGGFLLEYNAAYRKGVPATEKNLDLLRAAGIAVVTCENKFYISEQEEAAADRILKDSGLQDNDFIAAIHPFAGYSSKNWQEDKFAQLMGWLYEKYAAKIILLGSEKDKEANSKIAGMAKCPVINLSGAIPLGVLPALLKRVDVFVGVDSGPSHIAAAVQRPAVILYSATNHPSEWLPSDSNTVIIRKDVSCSDCQKLNCRQHLCMELITPEDVMDALKQVLKR